MRASGKNIDWPTAEKLSSSLYGKINLTVTHSNFESVILFPKIFKKCRFEFGLSHSLLSSVIIVRKNHLRMRSDMF